MRRRVVAVLLVACAVVATSCSAAQVTLWFKFHQHQDLSIEEATRIANDVNAKVPVECDDNYTGCVPNNQVDIDCEGSGDGPYYWHSAVLVKGWDHYGLDEDGDKVACGEFLPPPPPADDPQFATCTAAKNAGYGPYFRGVDPEYAWYNDADDDGIVCE